MGIPAWQNKIRRFSIRGRMYWYITADGGYSWQRISAAEAMRIIDSLGGVTLP